jgi:hypothetical protein
MRDVQRSVRQTGQPGRAPVARRRQRPRLSGLLCVFGQPSDVLLMEQAAYFRLMRKHGILLSVRRRWRICGYSGLWELVGRA